MKENQKLNEFVSYEKYITPSEIDQLVLSIKEKNSVSHISKEELRKAYVDYSELTKIRRVVHLGPEYIKENDSLFDDVADLVDDLKHIYKFSDWQVIMDDFNRIGMEQIYVKLKYEHPLVDIIIADIDENEKIITDFIKNRGMFLIRKVKDDTVEDMSFSHLVYTPVKQDDVRQQIDSEYLYHITPAKYAQSVSSEGIKARERNGENGIYYPPRVYMSFDRNFLLQYRGVLIGERTQEGYVMFTVEILSLSSELEIYLDPLVGRPCVYIESDVPPSAIVKIENI